MEPARKIIIIVVALIVAMAAVLLCSLLLIDPFADGSEKLAYEMMFTGDEADPWQTAETVKQVLQQRMHDMSTAKRFTISPDGREITVEVPKTTPEELAWIRSVVESPGRLEFRLVNNDPDVLRNCRPGDEPPEGHTWYQKEDRTGEGEWLLVEDGPPGGVPVTGDMVSKAWVERDKAGRIFIYVEFDPTGRGNLFQVTGANIRERLAIIINDVRDADDNIVSKGTLYSAPVIMAAISGRAVISGQFTLEEADIIRMVLSADPLPVSLQLVSVSGADF